MDSSPEGRSRRRASIDGAGEGSAAPRDPKKYRDAPGCSGGNGTGGGWLRSYRSTPRFKEYGGGFRKSGELNGQPWGVNCSGLGGKRKRRGRGLRELGEDLMALKAWIEDGHRRFPPRH